MKTAVAADIVIGNMSMAIEMDIVESGTGRGSIGRGSSGSHMGTGIGSGSAMVKERGSGTRRDGMIGTETMVAPVAVVVGRRAWRGNSTRNIGRTTIGAASSGVMMSMVTVEGVKRARLLVGAGWGWRWSSMERRWWWHYAREEVADSRRECSPVTAQMQGLWMGCPCTRV